MCSFLHFSLSTCFEMLSWNFAHDFVLMYYRSSSSVVTLQPSGSPSVHHFSELASNMHWQLSWNCKFDFCFFNAFLLEKRYKRSLLKCSWRAYYAPFAVLRYISFILLNFLHVKWNSTRTFLPYYWSWPYQSQSHLCFTYINFYDLSAWGGCWLGGLFTNF